MSGVKNDKGKPPLSMIPRTALEQEALVFAFGKDKYGKGNYQKGMDWSRLIDSSLRHIYAFASGETYDIESSMNHLAHARSNLAMLLHLMELKTGKDDRNETS